MTVGTGDQKPRICDIRSQTITHSLIGHKEMIKAIKWFPGHDNMLVTGSFDKTIKFWDIRKAGFLMSLNQHNSSFDQDTVSTFFVL